MRGPIPCPPSLTLVIIFFKSEYNKRQWKSMRGPATFPLFLSLVLKEIKTKEIKKGRPMRELTPIFTNFSRYQPSTLSAQPSLLTLSSKVCIV